MYNWKTFLTWSYRAFFILGGGSVDYLRSLLPLFWAALYLFWIYVCRYSFEYSVPVLDSFDPIWVIRAFQWRRWGRGGAAWKLTEIIFQSIALSAIAVCQKIFKVKPWQKNNISLKPALFFSFFFFTHLEVCRVTECFNGYFNLDLMLSWALVY